MAQKVPRIEWLDNEKFKIRNSEISLKPESFRGTDRPLSQLVKVLKSYSNKTSEDIYKCLGLKNKPCVDSKLNRGSFSVEDIVKIADYCGFDVVIRQRSIPEKLEKTLHGKTPEEQHEIISWLREWLQTEYGFTKEAKNA